MSERQQSLYALLRGLEYSGGVAGLNVDHISLDSRQVSSGGLFVALRGQHVDARTFIADVLDRGAVAALIEDEALTVNLEERYLSRVIRVKHLPAALSKIAGRFYGHPSRKMQLIGITGTNGKTSIAWYLAQVLEALGLRAGVMGTLGSGALKSSGDGWTGLNMTGYTTPDPIQVQKSLYEMLRSGVKVACIEVSSHALELGRVADLTFDTMVFSNLSQDHLDFHGSMQRYADAKMRLFREYDYKRAVVNLDDPYGEEILRLTGDRGLSFGVKAGELRGLHIHTAVAGLEFEMAYADQKAALSTRLIGEFNVYNMLAVAGVALGMGYTLAEIVNAIGACQAVPGRMHRVDTESYQPGVVVDYAHTPDALQKALSACRSHCSGMLTVVFGCGGDRDRGKRTLMGRIAESMADRVCITDDNPRGESPAAIVLDIGHGMSKPAWVLHDRAQAIHASLVQSERDDWVLIAGKGHEHRQVYADRVLEFDDSTVAAQALSRWAA